MVLAIALVFCGAAIYPIAAETELTMAVSNAVPLDGIKAVAAAFTAKTGIKISFELMPGGQEGDNLLKTRLASEDAADINLYNSGSLFLALNPPKYFVDLTAEPYMSSVIDSYKSVVSVGGRSYAAPAQPIAGGGWYYNKAIYAKLGLKVPKTWKDLISNLEKIKTANFTPVIASYKDSWTAQMVILADNYNVLAKTPRFAEDYTAHKATFAGTPAALRGFEKLAELNAKGLINKDATATTFDMALKMLATGQGAHYPMISFIGGPLAGIDPENSKNIGFFAQPGDDPNSNGLTIWMPNGLSIYKGSKNIAAAKRFIAFYMSPEGWALNFAAQKPDGPLAVKGIKMPDGLYASVMDMLPYVESGKTAPALEFMSPIKGPNLPQLAVQDALGQKSPLENAREYDKDVEKQAKQLGLAGW
jgi:raffinose/stachyose/melibiose transport system substrate-binding protein